MSRLFYQSTDKLQKSSNGNSNTNNFSYFALVKPTAMASNKYIVYNGNGVDSGAGWGLFLDATLEARVDLAFVATYASGLRLKFNKWNAVGYVRRSGTSIIFVNGYKAKTTSASAPSTPSAFYTIGARCNSSGTSQDPFKGMINDSVLWSRALNDAELFALTKRLIRPDRFRGQISQYHRLHGNGSTETAFLAGGTLTATGTLKGEAPPRLTLPGFMQRFNALGKAPLIIPNTLHSKTLMGVGI
jgi:hypothetical protein